MKNSKKNKQAVLQKFSLFMNEFKAMGKVDATTGEFTPETKELVDDLVMRWNNYCYSHGYYSLGKLLLIEIKVAKHMTLHGGNESEVRDNLTAETIAEYYKLIKKSKNEAQN